MDSKQLKLLMSRHPEAKVRYDQFMEVVKLRQIGAEPGEFITSHVIQLLTQCEVQNNLDSAKHTKIEEERDGYIQWFKLEHFLNNFNPKKIKDSKDRLTNIMFLNKMDDKIVIESTILNGEFFLNSYPYDDSKKLLYIEDPKHFGRSLIYVAMYKNMLNRCLEDSNTHTNSILFSQFLYPDKKIKQSCALNRYSIEKIRDPLTRILFENIYKMIEKNCKNEEIDNLEECLARLAVGLLPKIGTNFFDLEFEL